MIEVAPGKTVVAVFTPKLFYRINGDTKDVYDMPVETQTPLATLPCRSVAEHKGLLRRRSCSLAIHVLLHGGDSVISCDPS